MYMGAQALQMDQAVCDLYREGYTIHEVAEAAGISANTVSNILHEHNLARPRGKRANHPTKPAEIIPTAQVAELPAPAAPIAGIGVVCLACGCTEHLDGAAFCCRCGSKLETEAKRLKRALRNLYALACKHIDKPDIAKLASEDNELLLAFINEHAKTDRLRVDL